MKIKDIKVTTQNLLLSKPYTIAFKTIDVVENGIIEITGDDCTTGYGALNPSYEVVGETLEHAMEALTGESLAWLTGQNVSDSSSFHTLLQKTAAQFKHSAIARMGLEIALYDLYTQVLGIPLVQLFGQKILSMPTSITIGIKNVQDTLEEAKDYIARKFRILKVKLGVSPEEDVERLVKLREAFGYSTDIIIDMNQGYTPAQLLGFYDKVQHLQVQLIEQPFMRGEEEAMHGLPQNIRQLVAADESLVTVADAVKLASLPACGFFNIKLMKCDGIQAALDMAAIAQTNNIGLMWGCNDESIISITAALHLAFANPHTKFIDLDGSLDLAVDAVKGGFILQDGIMSIANKPGLGLERL